jgi:hypothetical protein
MSALLIVIMRLNVFTKSVMPEATPSSLSERQQEQSDKPD